MGMLAALCLIVILPTLSYLPSLYGGFLIDDDILLTSSRLIQASDGVWRFWFTTDAIDYWPVSNTSLWLEWRLWGPHPMGYRVTNLILHIGESVLMWRILSRLGIPGAFLAALLFAVHPVNVESVAWISQRKTLLAMLFVQMATLLYLKSETAPRVSKDGGAAWVDRWYGLSVVAFTLALLSKVSVALFPLLLLVPIAWLRPIGRRDIARIALLFVPAATLVLVNIWFRAGDPHIQDPSNLFEAVLRGTGTAWFYLGKAVYPFNLAFMYTESSGEPARWLSWIPLIAAVATTALLVRYRTSRSRPLLFAWVYYWIALFPALGLTETAYVEDHYQHLALIGVTAVVASGWATLRERAQGSVARALNVLVVVLVGVLVVLTWRHAALFTDNVVLMRAAVATYPTSAVAHRNLGFVLLRDGTPDQAIPHLEQALRIEPDFVEAHTTLAATLAAAGDLPRAIDHLRQAIRLRPNDPEALANLAGFLREAHRPAEAVPLFERALRVYPESSRTHCNLGKALLQLGEVTTAIEHFEEALRLDPDSAEAKRLLALALDSSKTSRRIDGPGTQVVSAAVVSTGVRRRAGG